jgi:hypothetical protein
MKTSYFATNNLSESQYPPLEDHLEKQVEPPKDSISRRSFLGRSLAAGAGTVGAGLLASAPTARARGGLTTGDAAILRFLAAVEILEDDLWQQYNELGGIQDPEVPGGTGNQDYTEALEAIDEDMPQYIHDNTDDEDSHFKFINAYLTSKGVRPVHLERFRTLPSSQATGAQQIGRLTNLMQLTVDTSWWTRYRFDNKNPDFGDTFPQAVPDLIGGQFPAIPRNDGDLTPPDHLQAIANTAAFHFGTIEQGGTSLYPSLAQRVTDREALRILLSIGPSETMHFQIWNDTAGHAPSLTDPTNGLTFPDLSTRGEHFEPELVMPEPCPFLSRRLPICSIIRPTETDGAAMGAVNFLAASGLFIGQSPEFFNVMTRLAQAADAAQFGG